MREYRDDAERMLAARIGDALDKCERGEVAVLPYLTPRERKTAERELAIRGKTEAARFFGGYADAERVCLFLLPEYLTAMSEGCTENDWKMITVLLEDTLNEAIFPLRVSGSGYRVLSHRDYLGSILALGLERDAIGDIALQNEHEAVIFCTARIAEFLMANLERVASDRVRCSSYTVDETFTDGRHYRAISDTVASPRLDCVVAALTNLSREDAQSAIRGGLVEVDFEPAEQVDLLLTPPATISVRGYGRYILRSFDGETRKGRFCLRADQLV